MTAMSLTLQANDALSKDLEISNTDLHQENTISQIADSNNFLPQYNTSDTNEGTMGSSGSFLPFSKTVSFVLDADNSNNVTEGDTLIYNMTISNNESTDANNVILSDELATNTTLVAGTVTTTAGIVTSGNTPNNNNTVRVDIGNLLVNDFVDVSFAATVNAVPDGQIDVISNQALVTTSNLGFVLSDNPNSYLNFPARTETNAYGQTILRYDENISGDFVDHYSIPTPVQLISEIERIKGTIGGLNVDFEDCFQFNVEESRRVTSLILEDYNPPNVQGTTSFQVFTGLPPIELPVGDVLSIDISIDHVGMDLIGFSGLTSGLYSVCLFEGEPGYSYSLVFESEIDDPIFNNNFE